VVTNIITKNEIFPIALRLFSGMRVGRIFDLHFFRSKINFSRNRKIKLKEKNRIHWRVPDCISRAELLESIKKPTKPKSGVIIIGIFYSPFKQN
jgi:hypothetical protein